MQGDAFSNGWKRLMVAAIALTILFLWVFAALALAQEQRPGESDRAWRARRDAEIYRKTVP